MMKSVPSVSVTYAQNGNSTKSNEFGMRTMQERAFEKRGEQYLLIKSPPASGKSRALMFIALDKLANQGIKQAIVVVPANLLAPASMTSRSATSDSGQIGQSSRNGTFAIHQGQTAARSNRLQHS